MRFFPPPYLRNHPKIMHLNFQHSTYIWRRNCSEEARENCLHGGHTWGSLGVQKCGYSPVMFMADLRCLILFSLRNNMIGHHENNKHKGLAFPFLPFQCVFPSPLFTPLIHLYPLPIMKNSSLVMYWSLHLYTNGICKPAANKTQCSLIQYVSTAGMLST